MKKLSLFLAAALIVGLLISPVKATAITAPEAPADVQQYMPEDTESFSNGLWYVIRSVISTVKPDIAEAAKTCLSLIAVVLLISLINQVSKRSAQSANLLLAVSVGFLMFRSTNVFIQIGSDTIVQMSDYGKLLLPALTAAAASNGAATAATALYAGTLIFISLLTTLISKCIVPLVYIYMALSIAGCAIQHDVFKGIKKFVKWLTTWLIKTVLYVFSGYMGITGVIHGSVDAAAIKATKLTISSAVPVVGSILSDASETILVSAGIMKNSIGIYGLLATIAICLGPFLRIGIHYLLLKLTSGICGVFALKQGGDMLQEMTDSMGLILAMTGSVCLMLLISIVCYIRSST